MCTHEIWTYSECGCHVDHHVPCAEARYLDQVTPRTLRRSQTSPQLKASIPENQSPSRVNGAVHAERMFRACSINRTVQKEFLEPICEDCLMEEINDSQPCNANGGGSQLSTSKSLVWDSDVKIEVNDQNTNGQSTTSIYLPRSKSDAKILESNVEVRISDAGTEDTRKTSLSQFPTYSRTPTHSTAPTPFSNGDADSESSVPDTSFRGRARSRTKQLRRLAMDVSREDIRLRVSSRLPSFQRTSLQNFKNELQREHETKTASSFRVSPKKTAIRPMRSLFDRFAEAQEETWLKARDAMNGLGRKMSKKPECLDRATRMQDTTVFKSDPAIGFHNGHTYSFREVHSDAPHLDRSVDTDERPNTAHSVPPESFYLSSDDPFHPAVQQNVNVLPEMCEIAHSQPSSWRDHLATDLTSKTRSKHRVALQPNDAEVNDMFDGRAQIYPEMHINKPSTSTTTTAVSSRNWTVTHPSNSSNPFSHQSFEYSTADELHARELKRRLLSASHHFSCPETESDFSSHVGSGPLQDRRLASLVAPDDFDEDDPFISATPAKDIEDEMAMVGLTDNPWMRCRSASTMENLPDTPVKIDDGIDNVRSKKPISTPVRRTEGTGDIGYTPQTAIRGPSATIHSNPGAVTSSFASRVQTSQKPSTHQPVKSISALSACQSFNLDTSPASNENKASTPSPTPSPVSPFRQHDFSQSLAIHNLSTPFHHSLQPRTPRSPLSQSIEAVLLADSKFVEKKEREEAELRPRTAPDELRSTKPLGDLPGRELPATPERGCSEEDANGSPEAHSNFALNTSPTSVFSCVWIRELCPGSTPADIEVRLNSDGHTGETSEEHRDEIAAPASIRKPLPAKKACGRVAGQHVRSCLCSGVVRFRKSELADGQGDMEYLEDDDLERTCRSVAPVVRYVVGKEVCRMCQG